MMRLLSPVFTVTLVTLFTSVMPTLSSQAMQVEVDIFSSRPNPHWTVTREEADQFVRLLQALPESNRTAIVDEGLGYNGLIVTELDSPIDGYQQVSVFKGLVVAWQDNQPRQFMDRERKLEQWLLHTGKGRVDDELYRLIDRAAQFE